MPSRKKRYNTLFFLVSIHVLKIAACSACHATSLLLPGQSSLHAMASGRTELYFCEWACLTRCRHNSSSASQMRWRAVSSEWVKETSMAASSEALADRPRLVNKKDGRSEIWNFFAYLADINDNPIDTLKPVCKTCFKGIQTKGGNTSNLAKHLSDRHPIQRVKDRQVSMWLYTSSPTRTAPSCEQCMKQPFPTECWNIQRN